MRFSDGQTAQTITIPIVNDTHVEGNETLSVSLSNPTGATLGSPDTSTITIQDDDTNPNASNPFNDNGFFVRQQYLDFLLRQPDSGGYNDWMNVLGACGPDQGGLGSPHGCDRVHVSSGFFRSTEFGEKGYWLYRFFEVGLGRRPQFAEFMPEVRRLSGLMSAEEQEARRNDFINRFIPRADFVGKHSQSLTAQDAAQFVSSLEQTSGIILPEQVPPTQPGQPPQYGRSELIGMMQSGQLTPAQTLRAFVEQKVVWDTYFYRAFVAMQYFGYLRRDPDDAGYNDWVRVLTYLASGGGARPLRGNRRDTDRLLVDAARALIGEDHPAASGLAPLADLLGVSPFRLSRAFTRHMGVSLTRYRTRVRLGRALDRLEGGERSLATLAADLGFADQAHLTRTVTAELGHTPTALRRLL